MRLVDPPWGVCVKRYARGVPVPSALECLRCQRRYPLVSMPAGCPACSEEAAPSNVQPVYSRMQGLRPGRLSGSGLPRYISQLPVARDRLVSLGEGGTPIISAPSLGREIGLRRLLVKDERMNPTGSWRDRYVAVAMSQHTGADDITIGCAGSESLCVSAAAYAARAGMRSVSLLDGTVADTGGRAISNRASPPIGGDPLGIEGYKTIAYEIAEQLGFAVPDLVVVPAGLGDGIAGIWRGFRELADWGVVDAYPRMVAVEVGGALAAALAGGRDWVEPSVETTTNARALAGITGTVQSLHAVTESEGLVVRVTEPELEAARIILGEQEGIWADLAAAAPVAAAQKLANRGDVPARVQIVCVVTEHGLLDDSAVAPGTLQTVDARVDELLRVLAVRGE